MNTETKSASYINIKLNVNGFDVSARYFKKDIDNLFLPLIKTLFDMQKAKRDRLIVCLAAPPGAGKTTLSHFLSNLSETGRDMAGIQSDKMQHARIQSIGIDGFHYPQEYIEKHSVIIDGKAIPMKQVKGSPETFDLKRLTNSIRLLQENDIRWPIYDRNLHDVVRDAVLVKEKVVLIEGNWLLLDEAGWRDLHSFCDYSIFITAEENMLKERLIQRKIAGGTSPEKAAAFYAQSDGVNVTRVLTNRLASSCELTLTKGGRYRSSV